MKSHIFLTNPSVVSPRWKQAFPAAEIVFGEDDLHRDLSGTIVWIVDGNQQIATQTAMYAKRGAKVVVLSVVDTPLAAKIAIEAGAQGYVHYLAVASLLEQVAQVVTLGGLWIGEDLMRQLMVAAVQALPIKATPADLSLLTAREKAVAEAVTEGKSNKEIARYFDIGERTVKAHLSSIFEKLKVRDRLQLVLLMSGH